jgi:hypothetical protein
MDKKESTDSIKIDSMIACMLKDAGPNRRNVIMRIIEMAKRENYQLEPTGAGFHVCLSLNGHKIKMIQVWAGGLDQHKDQVLETRRQWISEFIDISEIDERTLNKDLQNGNFTPIFGEKNNFTLDFREGRKMFSEENGLMKMENSIVALANTIKKSAI